MLESWPGAGALSHRDLTCHLPTVQTRPLNLSLGFLDHLRNAWSSCCVPGVVLGAGLSNSGGSKEYVVGTSSWQGRGSCFHLPHVGDSADSWMLLAASQKSLYDFSRQLLACTRNRTQNFCICVLHYIFNRQNGSYFQSPPSFCL